MAFTSDETGEREVHMRPVGGSAGSTRVSINAGSEALWAPLGNELFCRNADTVIAVPIQTDPELEIGEAKPVFSGEFLSKRMLGSLRS